LASKILFVMLIIQLLVPLSLVQAEEEELPIITIEFVEGNVIDLDKGEQLIRANILIKYYNPQDGYHFMKITRLSDGEVIKESEFQPRYIDDYHFGTQISHYLEPSLEDEQLVGDYELKIYSEFGKGMATEHFSIIKSHNAQLNLLANKTAALVEQEPQKEAIESDTFESESRIPSWVHDIFVWYAEQTITEKELLSALEYLISQGIIKIDHEI
jgi:hypothetical protein